MAAALGRVTQTLRLRPASADHRCAVAVAVEWVARILLSRRIPQVVLAVNREPTRQAVAARTEQTLRPALLLLALLAAMATLAAVGMAAAAAGLPPLPRLVRAVTAALGVLAVAVAVAAVSE